jgi:deoxyribose-phosphate aldolase
MYIFLQNNYDEKKGNIMEINKYIDHTILKADAVASDIEKICREAIEYNFKAVCINAYYVPLAVKLLNAKDPLVCTVVGFPLGASPTATKIKEASDALIAGADEIDMVINIGALKDGDFDYVFEDINALSELCHKHEKVLKVILETCLLTDEQIVKACEISKSAKVDFVKTSTGFSTGGATIEHVKLMKQTVGISIMVKASGGVRDQQTAKAMIEAGATRIGASAGIEICKGIKSDSNY